MKDLRLIIIMIVSAAIGSLALLLLEPLMNVWLARGIGVAICAAVAAIFDRLWASTTTDHRRRLGRPVTPLIAAAVLLVAAIPVMSLA